MKKGLLYLGILSLLSVACYFITIYTLPNVIYSVVQSKSQKQGRIENQLYYTDLLDDKSRTVVMPNPDFLYVATFYNLADGDIQLTGTMPDSSYWSLAFYESNTVNYYIKNDMEFGTSNLNITLTKDKSKPKPGDETIESPADKGFMLIRILVTDASRVKDFKALQESVKFTPLQ